MLLNLENHFVGKIGKSPEPLQLNWRKSNFQKVGFSIQFNPIRYSLEIQEIFKFPEVVMRDLGPSAETGAPKNVFFNGNLVTLMLTKNHFKQQQNDFL